MYFSHLSVTFPIVNCSQGGLTNEAHQVLAGKYFMPRAIILPFTKLQPLLEQTFYDLMDIRVSVMWWNVKLSYLKYESRHCLFVSCKITFIFFPFFKSWIAMFHFSRAPTDDGPTPTHERPPEGTDHMLTTPTNPQQKTPSWMPWRRRRRRRWWYTY